MQNPVIPTIPYRGAIGGLGDTTSTTASGFPAGKTPPSDYTTSGTTGTGYGTGTPATLEPSGFSTPTETTTATHHHHHHHHHAKHPGPGTYAGAAAATGATAAGASYLAADALKPRWTRTDRVPPRNGLINALWHATYAFGAFWLWVFRLPFLLALRFAPTGGIQDFVWNINETVWRWTAPVISLIENSVYWLFAQADTLWFRLTTAIEDEVYTLKDKAAQVTGTGSDTSRGQHHTTKHLAGGYSGADPSFIAADALTPRWTRTDRVSPNNWLLNTLWHATYAFGAFWLWVFRLPFLLALRFAPAGGIQDFVWNVNETVWRWTAPVISLIENSVYWLFAQADTLWFRLTYAVEGEIDTLSSKTDRITGKNPLGGIVSSHRTTTTKPITSST